MDEQYIIDLKVKTAGIKPAIERIKELEAEISKVDAGTLEYIRLLIELQKVQNASNKSTKNFGNSIQDLKDKLGDFASKTLENLGKKLGLSENAMLGIGAAAGVAVAGVAAVATGVVALGVAALSLNEDFKLLEKTLKSTGLKGDSLKALANQAKFLKEQFDIDPREFGEGISNLVASFGITQQEAAKLIEQSAIAGGNSAGELTSLISEYSTQFAAGGVSANRFFDIVTSGAKLGSFQQEKQLDVIKEVGLRYKENTKATSDALKPLGDEFNNNLRKQFEIGAIAIDEVLLQVIKRSEELGLSNKETQTIIADLGGGPLEDIGNLKAAYDRLKGSTDGVKNATKQLSEEELASNQRTKNKIELQRQLADGLGSQLARVENAFTDAFYEILNSIEGGDEGIKKIADSVIEFAKDITTLTKDVIELVQGFGGWDEVLTTARITLAALTAGVSELIPIAVKAISLFAEARREANKPIKVNTDTVKSYEEIQKVLSDISKAYSGYSSSAKKAINEVSKEAETAAFTARISGNKIDENEVKAISERVNQRVSIVAEGQERIVKVNELYAKRISEADAKELQGRLSSYEGLINGAATGEKEINDVKIKAAEKSLADYLLTLDKRVKSDAIVKDKTIKNVKDISEVEKKRFDELKKSFETNFELQRLEAQKQYANGLINEVELKNKLRGIDLQENAVLITIIENKKEIAKTGEEDLEVAKLTLDTLNKQKDALDEQLLSRQRLKEADKITEDFSSKEREGKRTIEENNEVNKVLTSNPFQSEETKARKIREIRRKYANLEREDERQNLAYKKKQAEEAVTDAQKKADEIAASGLDVSSEQGLKALKDLTDAKLDSLGVDVRISNLEKEQTESDKEGTKDKIEGLENIGKQAQKVAGYINQVTSVLKEGIQTDIAALDQKLSVQESRIQAGVELAKMGNDELLNQELERQDKLLAEKEKLQKKENALNAIQLGVNVAAAGIQAAANIAVAVTKAAAQTGVAAPVGIGTTLGAIAIGLGASAGLIAGFFADGVIDFKGKGTGTSDSNIVAISHGESVITAQGTKNASKMLTMINEGKLKDSDYLSTGLNLDVIEDTNGMIDIRTELNEQISISRELLEEMKNFEKKVTFSADGITEYVRTRNKITKKLNTR